MATDVDNDIRTEVEEEVTRPTDAAAKHADVAQLHFYSAYLHVGPGAENCEEGEAGTCSNPTHFHAWCRLPNKLQHRDIIEKGLAAKARRIRALKDPESDSRAIMDAELANLDEGLIEAVIDEITSREWDSDYSQAVADVSDEEEFEHILQDRERYLELIQEQGDKPEDEQTEEYRSLSKHIQNYLDRLKARTEERQGPRRASLRDMGFTRCMEILRDQRIDRAGDSEFARVLKEWTWFVGTLKTTRSEVTDKPFERHWSAIGDPADPKPGTMFDAAPEVIEAVEALFEELNKSLVLAAAGGNS